MDFRLAPMSRLIRTLTVGLWILPVAFLATGAFEKSPLVIPGLLLVVLYSWVWLRFRPSRFVVQPDGIEVIWPLKRRRLLLLCHGPVHH